MISEDLRKEMDNIKKVVNKLIGKYVYKNSKYIEYLIIDYENMKCDRVYLCIDDNGIHYWHAEIGGIVFADSPKDKQPLIDAIEHDLFAMGLSVNIKLV